MYKKPGILGRLDNGQWTYVYISYKMLKCPKRALTWSDCNGYGDCKTFPPVSGLSYLEACNCLH